VAHFPTPIELLYQTMNISTITQCLLFKLNLKYSLLFKLLKLTQSLVFERLHSSTQCLGRHSLGDATESVPAQKPLRILGISVPLKSRLLYEGSLTCMSKGLRQDIVWWKIWPTCSDRRVAHHASDHAGLQTLYNDNQSSGRVSRVHTTIRGPNAKIQR